MAGNTNATCMAWASLLAGVLLLVTALPAEAGWRWRKQRKPVLPSTSTGAEDDTSTTSASADAEPASSGDRQGDWTTGGWDWSGDAGGSGQGSTYTDFGVSVSWRSMLLATGWSADLTPTDLPLVTGDLGFSLRPAGLGLDQAHAIATGGKVVVAVLDGGFNVDHPFIAGSMLAGYDVVERDDDVNDGGNGIDDDGDGVTDAAIGHGTFVSGMVLMAAPDALVLPIRVVDDEGRGTTMEISDGIDYALKMGVDVINLSIETAANSNYICTRLEEAAQMGVIVVVSAGNQSSDELELIAKDPQTISVGALANENCLAPFSNFNAEISTFAPGADLIGPVGWPAVDSWATWSGTSFAAGFVSGAAAIARQIHPGMDGEEFKSFLERTGRSVYDVEGVYELVGDGRLHLGDLVTELAKEADWDVDEYEEPDRDLLAVAAVVVEAVLPLAEELSPEVVEAVVEAAVTEIKETTAWTWSNWSSGWSSWWG